MTVVCGRTCNCRRFRSHSFWGSTGRCWLVEGQGLFRAQICILFLECTIWICSSRHSIFFYILVPAGVGGVAVVVVAVAEVDGLLLCQHLPRAARRADLWMLPVVEVVPVVPPSFSFPVVCCLPATLQSSLVDGLWVVL